MLFIHLITYLFLRRLEKKHVYWKVCFQAKKDLAVSAPHSSTAMSLHADPHTLCPRGYADAGDAGTPPSLVMMKQKCHIMGPSKCGML